jgi:hypothetical protein
MALTDGDADACLSRVVRQQTVEQHDGAAMRKHLENRR